MIPTPLNLQRTSYYDIKISTYNIALVLQLYGRHGRYTINYLGIDYIIHRAWLIILFITFVKVTNNGTAII